MKTSSLEASVLKESEFNRFGLISIILLVVGCVVPTMTTLSLLLAVTPMKWIWR